MADAGGSGAHSHDAGKPVRVRLHLSAPFRKMLTDIIERVHVADDTLASPTLGHGEAPDPDLQAAWAEGLRDGVARDARELLDLVKRADFGVAGAAALDIAAAESLTRACVRVRLYLRRTVLADLKTDDIEGEVDFYKLSPPQQQAFAAYRTLVHLESDLVLQLDPEAAQG